MCDCAHGDVRLTAAQMTCHTPLLRSEHVQHSYRLAGERAAWLQDNIQLRWSNECYFFLFFLNKKEEALEKIIHFFSTTFFPSFLQFFLRQWNATTYTLILLFATLYIFFLLLHTIPLYRSFLRSSSFVFYFPKKKKKCARQTSHWHRSIVLRKKRIW